jgi:hypothetical protein
MDHDSDDETDHSQLQHCEFNQSRRPVSVYARVMKLPDGQDDFCGVVTSLTDALLMQEWAEAKRCISILQAVIASLQELPDALDDHLAESRCFFHLGCCVVNSFSPIAIMALRLLSDLACLVADPVDLLGDPDLIYRLFNVFLSAQSNESSSVLFIYFFIALSDASDQISSFLNSTSLFELSLIIITNSLALPLVTACLEYLSSLFLRPIVPCFTPRRRLSDSRLFAMSVCLRDYFAELWKESHELIRVSHARLVFSAFLHSEFYASRFEIPIRAQIPHFILSLIFNSPEWLIENATLIGEAFFLLRLCIVRGPPELVSDIFAQFPFVNLAFIVFDRVQRPPAMEILRHYLQCHYALLDQVCADLCAILTRGIQLIPECIGEFNFTQGVLLLPSELENASFAFKTRAVYFLAVAFLHMSDSEVEKFLVQDVIELFEVISVVTFPSAEIDDLMDMGRDLARAAFKLDSMIPDGTELKEFFHERVPIELVIEMMNA